MTNLEKFRYYLEDCCSPDHFIDWNFYFMISSALGRRVWWGHQDWELFPNQYLFFVGGSGLGKSLPAAKATRPMLEAVKVVEKDKDGKPEERSLIHLSATSTTLQRLYDDMARATEQTTLPDGKPYAHTSMTFLLPEEAGSLFQKNTEDIVTFLTDGWNGGNYERRIKMEAAPIIIKNMCINFLGCCTPEWMERNMSSSLLSEGFAGRTIFIWGEQKRKNSTIIRTSPEQQAAKREIINWLHTLTTLRGRVECTEEAFKWFDDWVQTKMDIKLNSAKQLDKYYGRRKEHLVKLAMAIHYSDKKTMVLDLEDFMGAEKVLLATEFNMHRALCGHGKNPIHTLAQEILQDLATGPMTYKKILLRHFTGGENEDVDKALNWLGATDQIEPGTACATAQYRLKV